MGGDIVIQSSELANAMFSVLMKLSGLLVKVTLFTGRTNILIYIWEANQYTYAFTLH